MKVGGDLFKIMYMYEWYGDKMNMNEEVIVVEVPRFVGIVEIGIKPTFITPLPFEVGADYIGRTNGQDIGNPLDKNLFNTLRRLNHLAKGKTDNTTLRLAVSKPLAQRLRAEGVIQ